MKKCERCNKKKQLSDFGKNQAFQDGYYSACKACREAMTAWNDAIQRFYTQNKSKGEGNRKQRIKEAVC